MKKILMLFLWSVFLIAVQGGDAICQGTFKLKSGVETSYRVYSHPRFLQFKIRCSEPAMDQLQCQGNIHDVSVWRGDSVELFIKPSKKGGTIAQFAISPNGSTYDALVQYLNRDANWSPVGIEVKTEKGKDFWSIDMKIPFGLLIGTLNEGDKKGCDSGSWSFNLVRNRRAGMREMISCAPADHWLEYQKYIKLKNVRAEYSVSRWNISGLKAGKVQKKGGQYTAELEGTVDNMGDRMRLVTVHASLTDAKRSVLYRVSEEKLALAKGQMFRLQKTVEFPESGNYQLEIYVKDKQSLLSYHSVPVKLEFVPIKLSIVSGAFRGRELFASMPLKDLVFKVQTDHPVRAGDTCELLIRDAAKKVVVQKKVAAETALAKNISIKLPHRKPGIYSCEAKFSTPGLPVATTQLRIHSPVENEIYLAENGNFVRNGKEFFAIGGFGYVGKFLPPGYEKTGSYSVGYGPVRPPEKGKGAYSDGVKEYGSSYMPFPEPPELWTHPVSPAHAKRALRPIPPEAAKRIGEVISGWKGSNEIFGWYLADEPSETKCLPAYYDQISAICHEYDPYHMTFMTFQSSSAGELYGNACDVVIFDYFPGFHEKGKNHTLDYIVRMAEETAQGIGPGKSLISAPPLYAYVDNSTLMPRYATFDELRCMVYSSLTHDAVRGICWNDISRCGVSLDQYIGVQRISRNLKALEKFWLSRNLVKLNFSGEQASKLQWIAKKVNGKLYILLVNPSDDPLKIDLKLPADSGVLRELDSDKAQTLYAGRNNQLSFAPLQVRIFSADPAAPKLITVDQIRKSIRDFEEKELKSGNLCYYKRGAETIHSLVYVKDSKSFRFPANRRMVNDGLTTWLYNVRPFPKEDPEPFLGIKFKKAEKVSRIEVYWHSFDKKSPDASNLIFEGAGSDGKWKALSVTGCKTVRNGNVVQGVCKISPAEVKQIRIRFKVKNPLHLSVCEIKAFNN